jgi:hypothetical protein
VIIFNITDERGGKSLIARAKPDIVTVWHERKPSRSHSANGIMGGTPQHEGCLGGTDLGRSPTDIWVLISNIMDELILGHILHTYDASADLRR